MAFLPEDLRSADLVWLLEIDWLGKTIRLAERLESAPFGPQGSSVDFLPGLDVGGSVDQALDLFSDSSSLPSVALTMHLGGLVDVPAEIARGRDFSAAKGVLSLWARGDREDRQDRIVVVSGRFRSPEYGDASEPITATLEELPATEPDLIPAAADRIEPETWPDAPQSSALHWYPQIIGSPGAGATYGSAAFAVDFVSAGKRHLLIAGHKVAAPSVSILNADDGSVDSLSVSHIQDGRGKTVAVVNLLGSAVTVSDSGSYWCKWPVDAGGFADHSGEPVSGAGSALRWLLERSSLRWDRGRVAAAVDYLNAFRVDFAIQPQPDQRVDPWDFIQQHLLPILPITPSHATASGGLGLVLWRFDARSGDEVAHIMSDDAQVVRRSAVSYSDLDALANEFRLSFAWNAESNKPTSSYTMSGDELVIADGASSNNFCRVSRNRYGSRVKELGSEVVYDDATAAKICSWWSRAFSLTSRAITYSAPATLGYLELGDPVLLTDDKLSMFDQLGLVTAIRWVAGREIELTIRVIEDPGRDYRAA